MLEEFEDDIFGEYVNHISETKLEKNLAHIGWKYFSLKSLNEHFAIKLAKYGE